MSSSNLTQLHAARPLTGALSAATDLFYVADVSETTDANIDKGMTRHELLRAIAESARLGGSKYLTPFLPQITGLTGGGTTKLDGLLDGLVVTDAQIPFAVDLSFSDDYQRWKLRVKAVGEVADGVTLIAPVNTAFSAYIFCRMPIPNTALGNSTITLGSSTLTLGSTTTTVAGLTLTSPILTTPALGTPASGVATNLTGTAAGLTAGNVTTNANLTGDVLSSGNATTLATVATAGTSGSSTSIPVVTINAKGLTTSITTAAVIAPAGTLTGATLASGVTASSLTTVGTLQSPVMVTPALGTPASGVATNLTGLPLTTGVTGTLAVTNGGTGVSAAPSNGQLLIGNGSGFVNSTLTAGENITITNGPGSITIAAAGGSLASFEDGTAAEPSIAFINELSTGVFRASTNVLGFAVGGTSRATMTNTGITVAGTITPTGSVHAAAGLVGNPSLAFNADQNTGLYNIGPDNIGVAAGGAKVLDIATTGLSVTGALSVSGAATLGAGAILNTPASGTLTNATGLPISTGVSGLGTGVATFLATPSSANLAAALTDETGTGANVFATSPTLTTPISASLTSPAATNLTLAGGSSGASLVLGQGATAANVTLNATTSGFLSFTKSEDSSAPTLARILNAGATTAGRYNEVIFGKSLVNGGAGTLGYKSDSATPANSRLFLVHYGNNQDTGGVNLTNTGNLLIGTSTSPASYGKLVVSGGMTTSDDALGKLVVVIYSAGTPNSYIKLGALSTSLRITNAADTTDLVTILNAGEVSIASTTAGASNAGALVVAGGISAGQSAQASWFGGNVSISGPATATLAINSADGVGNGSAIAFISDGSYKWIAKAASFTDGSLFTIGKATGVFTSTPVLSLNYSTAAATFAGAVTIGNTVNTVSPTSPNRTITMVVNGVTLYLAAKTTND